ncbi:hypothetical protein Hanom_Chr05g00408761 [Helianthus anomalus]
MRNGGCFTGKICRQSTAAVVSGGAAPPLTCASPSLPFAVLSLSSLSGSATTPPPCAAFVAGLFIRRGGGGCCWWLSARTNIVGRNSPSPDADERTRERTE